MKPLREYLLFAAIVTAAVLLSVWLGGSHEPLSYLP